MSEGSQHYGEETALWYKVEDLQQSGKRRGPGPNSGEHSWVEPRKKFEGMQMLDRLPSEHLRKQHKGERTFHN